MDFRALSSEKNFHQLQLEEEARRSRVRSRFLATIDEEWRAILQSRRRLAVIGKNSTSRPGTSEAR
jgi:hypothetical protein